MQLSAKYSRTISGKVPIFADTGKLSQNFLYKNAVEKEREQHNCQET